MKYKISLHLLVVQHEYDLKFEFESESECNIIKMCAKNEAAHDAAHWEVK